MKRFEQREQSAAIAFSEAGGQALHVCKVAPFVKASTPNRFKRSDEFAHLFDMDEMRLTKTARYLGVRKILVEHRGTERQHIDLCAGPLLKAIKKAAHDNATDRVIQQQATLLFTP